jgi:cell division protein FtsL
MGFAERSWFREKDRCVKSWKLKKYNHLSLSLSLSLSPSFTSVLSLSREGLQLALPDPKQKIIVNQHISPTPGAFKSHFGR